MGFLSKMFPLFTFGYLLVSLVVANSTTNFNFTIEYILLILGALVTRTDMTEKANANPNFIKKWEITVYILAGVIVGLLRFQHEILEIIKKP